MRRLGLVLLFAGALLFLMASSRRGGYDSFEGSMRATFSKSERSKRDFWGAARTVGIVAGVAGIVLVVVSGRKS
ncbi:MAG: hypothetical protein WCC53_07775 [Thermoanaerobaculia bacterium]|jgi:hypothetical protein